MTYDVQRHLDMRVAVTVVLQVIASKACEVGELTSLASMNDTTVDVGGGRSDPALAGPSA
jgi:hypothetical protein